MLHRFSTSLIRILCEDPADAEIASHRLLVRAYYVRRAAPGVHTWLPLGLRTLHKIEDTVHQEMDAMGGQEAHFPAFLPAEPYQATGRRNDYGPTLFKPRDRKDGDYLLAPTHEGMFTLVAKDLYPFYKDLSAVVYQIQTKYRDEARPRVDITCGREFIMKDSHSFDIDDADLVADYQAHRDIYEWILTRPDLDYVTVNATTGTMGGSRSEEFLHPCEIGEDTFVRSPSGYVANAEAVTTVVPELVDASGIGPARVADTPDTPTIDPLAELCNHAYPRSDGRAWTAADILRNVAIILTHPGGERELLVIGVLGDRNVDTKCLEIAAAPAEVEMAGDTDFETNLELVCGYIGPSAIGPNSPLWRVEKREDGTEVLIGSVRYLVDPRIAEGTGWVTGANSDEKYVLDPVMGRDFIVDGTIEATEVREGDLTPDGSGPLHLACGIETGHIFELGRKYSQALRPTVLDKNGKARVVTMGSYGIGVSCVMAVLAEANHDDEGLTWPAQITPYYVQVLATGKDQAVFDVTEQVASSLDAGGVEVLYGNRRKVSAGVKFTDTELLGLPYTLVVGWDLAKEGTVEIRDRRTGEYRSVPTNAAAAELSTTVRTALEAARH